jgi:ribosomal protein L22
MTPDSPQDPQKGKVDESAVPEDATQTTSSSGTGKDAKQAPEEAAAQPEPKPKKPRAKKKKPESAAETTGVDTQTTSSSGTGKDAAEAEEAKPKPRRPRAKAADRDAEAAKAEDRDAEAAEAEDRDAEAAEAEGAAPVAAARPRKRDRRSATESGVLVRAQAKYVRTSARKARLVCDHIRGKDVAEARSILAFTPRAAAKPWLKLLESAVANAEHNHELVGEDLRIVAVHADEGPTLKRYRPRAMGRATRIRKRTSHLTITLTPKES